MPKTEACRVCDACHLIRYDSPPTSFFVKIKCLHYNDSSCCKLTNMEKLLNDIRLLLGCGVFRNEDHIRIGSVSNSTGTRLKHLESGGTFRWKQTISHFLNERFGSNILPSIILEYWLIKFMACLSSSHAHTLVVHKTEARPLAQYRYNQILCAFASLW